MSYKKRKNRRKRAIKDSASLFGVTATYINLRILELLKLQEIDFIAFEKYLEGLKELAKLSSSKSGGVDREELQKEYVKLRETIMDLIYRVSGLRGEYSLVSSDWSKVSLDDLLNELKSIDDVGGLKYERISRIADKLVGEMFITLM